MPDTHCLRSEGVFLLVSLPDLQRGEAPRPDALRAVFGKPKEAAAREGRPESEYFREAFRIAVLRARRWSGDLDIPEIGFGGPVTDQDVRAATEEAANRKHCAPGDAA